MRTDLVLEGGGVKGIALVGAIGPLVAAGYRFPRIAGTSAGAIVGSITFFPDANEEGLTIRLPDRTAGIRATAVAPAARGLGIGRQLAEACIDRAEATAAHRIALHTATFMAAAMRLYERAGFERVPAWDFPAADFFGGDSADAVIAMGFARAIS